MNPKILFDLFQAIHLLERAQPWATGLGRADGSNEAVRLRGFVSMAFQASDIHLECDAASLVIKYRVDGVLVQAGQVQGLQMAEQIISRIKVLSNLDISEDRLPQDGRILLTVSGRPVDLRVSTLPTIFFIR